MPCSSPLRAWQHPYGEVHFREPLDREKCHYTYLLLPCGSCIGCRRSKAREWAFRARLEDQLHDKSCWVTLTYDQLNLPPTLSKPDLSAYIKRVRAGLSGRCVRFLASGEYGEINGRPHYHAILWGVTKDDHPERHWHAGRTQVDTLTPAAIQYVAGYTAKKVGRPFAHQRTIEYTDLEGRPATIAYQDSFLSMSKKPGLGAHAREHWRSWRDHAIDFNGTPLPVPRYLHRAYLTNATPSELQTLQLEKQSKIHPELTPQYLSDLREINLARQNLQRQKRAL